MQRPSPLCTLQGGSFAQLASASVPITAIINPSCLRTNHPYAAIPAALARYLRRAEQGEQGATYRFDCPGAPTKDGGPPSKVRPHAGPNFLSPQRIPRTQRNTRVLRLAFLSPKLVEMILTGKQPAGVTAAALMRTEAVPAGWGAQASSLASAH